MKTKTCQSCKETKLVEEFPTRKDNSGRTRPYCKNCSKDVQKARYAYYRQNNPFKHRCTRSRTRAKSLKVAFDLTPEYLQSIWTGVCPVLGVSLNLVTDAKDELAAELDRFIPEKGYTKGNVHFLSRKANRLKNNVSTQELKNLLKWMEKVESES